MKGSTIAEVKAALIDALIARPGLAGVNVSYRQPIQAADLQTDDGLFEAIWLGDADGEQNVIVFKALPLFFDEAFQFDVSIQVIRRTTDASQAEADTRAVELLGEVLGTLAADPTLGVADDDFRRCETTPTSWRHLTGHLPTAVGFGSRFEVRLAVDSRLALT